MVRREAPKRLRSNDSSGAHAECYIFLADSESL
jgi:hypothetical protein